jgi:hypothetical protein
VSERDSRRWLEGLEMPDLMRRLDILSAIPENKATPEGLKRTVRAFNPAPKSGDRASCVGGTARYRNRTTS